MNGTSPFPSAPHAIIDTNYGFRKTQKNTQGF